MVSISAIALANRQMSTNWLLMKLYWLKMLSSQWHNLPANFTSLVSIEDWWNDTTIVCFFYYFFSYYWIKTQKYNSFPNSLEHTYFDSFFVQFKIKLTINCVWKNRVTTNDEMNNMSSVYLIRIIIILILLLVPFKLTDNEEEKE